MVVINTQHDIEIKHIVDIRNTNSFIATARERGTNRTKCFLFNTQRGEIYTRNGSGWVRINDPYLEQELHTLIREALGNRNIPQYSTAELSGILS